MQHKDFREKVNIFLEKKIDVVKRFFAHKIYVYSYGGQSGFVTSFSLDKKERRCVTISVLRLKRMAHETKYYLLTIPASSILKYRKCYSNAQLFFAKLIGINLQNKNRKLQSWR